jgi:cation transport ATPase
MLSNGAPANLQARVIGRTGRFVEQKKSVQAKMSGAAPSYLSDLTQPTAQVRRNGALATVPVEDILIGDALFVEEGGRVAADGRIDNANDCSVDISDSMKKARANTSGL